MARVRYTEQLEGLRRELAALTADVAGALTAATAVLLNGDLATAERLIVADADVDERVAAVEGECVAVLALQSPVAGGLRQVLAAMRIAGDVARSGDLVVNICKAARRIYGHRVPSSVAEAVRDMSDRAFVMLTETADACSTSDGGRLGALRAMDSELDESQARLLAAVFEEEARSSMDPQMAIQIAVVGRFYERLGDHAVNIVERIVYADGTGRNEERVSEPGQGA